jgi:YihY family inner membrane protein
LNTLDRFQQRRPLTAIPVATWKKFSDEGSSREAAGMAFWAFFSVFPLLMALVTILGYLVPAGDRTEVLKHVSSYVPLLDSSAITGLTGSALALIVGTAAAVWSGLAVVTFTEQALNAVWGKDVEAGFPERTVRALLCLLVVGGGLLAATFLTGLLFGSDSAVDLGHASRALGVLAAVVIDVGLFVAAFRILTDDRVSLRDLLPGAVFSGVAFWVLQSLSSVIVTRHLASAQRTYGTFATVITMLWWFYLQFQLTLLGAQANVVLKQHRYPCSLFPDEGQPACPEPRKEKATAGSR